MTTSRKTYEAVAAAIKNERELVKSFDNYSDEETGAALMSARMIGASLADYFATDNPRFDRDKFMEASGLR